MKSGLLFSTIAMLAVSCLADTLIVDTNGSGDYLTIQSAIDVALAGDTILIRDGVYTGDGNRDISFKGKAITVKSENGPENCIIDCQGTEQEPHRGFNFHSGESRNSILDGVTIINGTTDEDLIVFDGGGGAIACMDWSNPTIKNCILKNNTTAQNQGGGGIFCCGASPYIYNCVIKNNSAGYIDGGGILCICGSNPTVENCIIINNSPHGINASGSPGCNVKVINCLIAWNTGAGISIDNGGNQEITNCTIYGNSASYSGGGVEVNYYCTTKIKNSIIWGNTRSGRLEQIEVSNANLLVYTSDIQGGRRDLRIRDYFDDRYYMPPSVITWDDNNIDADPYFIDPIQHDLRLGVGSPCIEIGNNTYISSMYDLAGNPRILDGDYDGRLIVDMGAYEAPKSDSPVISLSTWELNCVSYIKEDQPAEYKLQIFNGGGGEFTWSIINNCTWMEIYPLNGTTSSEIAEVTIKILSDNLDPGSYTDEFIIESSDTLNGAQVVSISLINVDEIICIPSHFNTIQEGIDYALDGYEIVIADGIYKGEGNTNLLVTKPVTIRSQNGARYCIIDCEDKYRCIAGTNQYENAFNLQGLTIQNAIEVQERSAIEIIGEGKIKDCVIQGCKIERYLGVICLAYGAEIENCLVKNNMSGIFCYDSTAIRNCDFVDNYGGPAILCEGNNGDIVWSNILANEGGGIVLVQSSPIISNCVIKDNSILAEHDGFGLGGGISCFFESNPSIENTLIEGNYAEFGGGGIYCEADSHASLLNCDVLGNKSLMIGGGIWVFDESSLDVKNSIIVENISSLGNQIAQEYPQYPGNSMVTLNFNCLQIRNGDVFDGESLQVAYGKGNLFDAPSFTISGYWDDSGTSEDWTDDIWHSGDYHLLPDSPCIDAGDPASDYSNEPWPNGGRIDMGAYGNTPEATGSRDGLIPLGFVTINKTRIGRTTFEYELAVIVRNSNAFDMTNVQMQLKDWDAAVLSVSDDSIVINTIPAGVTITSTDTFKIVVDRSTLVDSSKLAWILTYYVPAYGTEVQQTASMLLSAIGFPGGDITKDGRVNLEDFAIMAQQWDDVPGSPSADIASPWGHVGIEDLIYLAENWLTEMS